MASAAAASTAGRVITCKAMVQWENGGDLIEETVQGMMRVARTLTVYQRGAPTSFRSWFLVEPPKRGEVRIKILGCGVW